MSLQSFHYVRQMNGELLLPAASLNDKRSGLVVTARTEPIPLLLGDSSYLASPVAIQFKQSPGNLRETVYYRHLSRHQPVTPNWPKTVVFASTLFPEDSLLSPQPHSQGDWP